MSDALARRFDPIAVSSESTVVAEYVAEPMKSETYQSEAALERETVSYAHLTLPTKRIV